MVIYPAKEYERILHPYWTVGDLGSEPQASETLALKGTKTMSFMFWGQLAAGHISSHGNCLLRLGSGRRLLILGCHALVAREGGERDFNNYNKFMDQHLSNQPIRLDGQVYTLSSLGLQPVLGVFTAA